MKSKIYYAIEKVCWVGHKLIFTMTDADTWSAKFEKVFPTNEIESVNLNTETKQFVVSMKDGFQHIGLKND